MRMLLFIALIVGISTAQNYEWSSVQIRGGGYVPGVAFHPDEDGLVYVRTDVGGSYRLESDQRRWVPLNDMFTSGNDMGSIAIGLDPDNPDALYLTGGLYTDVSWCGAASFFRSDDRGASWTKITLKNHVTVTGADESVLTADSSLCLAGNGTGRGMGNRLAVSGNTIYLGTNQNGLLKSTDRGDSWTTVDAFDNTSGIGAVQFDEDGNIYAAPYAGGVYKSTDGSSWSQLGSFNGVIYQMSYSPTDNTIWFTTNTTKPLDQSEPAGGAVYTCDLSSGTISEVTMPAKGEKDYGYIGISVNPADPDQVFVSTSGWWKGTGGPASGSSFVPHDAIFMTTDGGESWVDIITNSTFDIASAYNAASSNPHWISALAVDPFDADHVIFGTGYGVWSTFDAREENPTWIFTDEGIEETVPLGLASTPYGAPLVSVLGDIDGFYHEDLNTPQDARHKVEDGVNEAGTNFDIDWAAQAPHYMVRIHKNSEYGLGAYSEDGGKSWKDFKTHPDYTVNPWNDSHSNEDNFVAVSADASAIVWNMATYGVYYSTDNGATWTASSTDASLLEGFRPVADRVEAGTFYLYNAGSGILYRSGDNGASWSEVKTGLAAVDSWAYSQMRLFASPDQQGELWLTQGANIYTCPSGCAWSEHFKEGLWFGDGGVLHSTDGGETFNEVPGLLYARSIGFGKGQGSSSIVYAVGIQDNGLQGVHRSDDGGSSWTRINDDEHRYGEVTMVVGDPCVYSRVYLGTSGRGIIQGIESGSDGDCDCEQRIDGGGQTSVIHKGAMIKKPSLMRRGMVLQSNAPIRLYTLSGRLIAGSMVSKHVATLDLTNLPRGLYVARSGVETMKIYMHE
ncbi:MAG: hypothetical protein ACOCW2_02650 [Chitinivibrionales bacterium]